MNFTGSSVKKIKRISPWLLISYLEEHSWVSSSSLSASAAPGTPSSALSLSCYPAESVYQEQPAPPVPHPAVFAVAHHPSVYAVAHHL